MKMELEKATEKPLHTTTSGDRGQICLLYFMELSAPKRYSYADR
jgi:hypothetical protein